MTAQEKYEQNSTVVKRTIDDLQKALKSHKQAAKQDSRNWANAGDLAHVQELLNEALEFLAGE